MTIPSPREEPFPVGPNDEVIDEFRTHTFLGPTRVVAVCPRPINGWPYADVYGALMAGDLLTSYRWFFDRGQLLGVMPVDRLLVSRFTFPTGLVIYPPGRLDLRSSPSFPTMRIPGRLPRFSRTLPASMKASCRTIPWQSFRCRKTGRRFAAPATRSTCLKSVITPDDRPRSA